MSRFEPTVLEPDPPRRGKVLSWLEAGLAAVDPERLTREALAGRSGAVALVAIGKAAPAMARGAASELEIEEGVCVSDHAEPVPSRVELLIGDHPIPGPASLAAGQAVLDLVRRVPSSIPILALISGGGSALCESPRPGVSADLLAVVNRRLIARSASIAEVNLVRSHLSAIKGGGVSRAAGRPIETLVLSDVAGADPGVVASGPTIPNPVDPVRVLTFLADLSIDLTPEAAAAVSATARDGLTPQITVLADARDAARAAAAAASPDAAVWEDWLEGEVAGCLDRLLDRPGGEVTVAGGETVLDVTADGRGGRNTHAALLAAERLAGTGDLFCAFATDGVDGRSGGAGAIVDGTTITRGGDPAPFRTGYDSAAYLARTSDLLVCTPTGTNVSDLWILWREG